MVRNTIHEVFVTVVYLSDTIKFPQPHQYYKIVLFNSCYQFFV